MSNDHVGVPKFIEKAFSVNNQIYVYDLKRRKVYSNNINKVGTESNYYELDIEKEYLANGIENEFSKFHSFICNSSNLSDIISIVKINKNLIEQFSSVMYFRAKKTLDIVNRESLTSSIFGNISHSDLLRFQSVMNINLFGIIGGDYNIVPLINKTAECFINNSIGLGFLCDNKKRISIIIPMNTNLCILITNNYDLKINDLLYISSNDIDNVIAINNALCRFEIIYGNGFIFSKNDSSLLKYKQYIENIM